MKLIETLTSEQISNMLMNQPVGIFEHMFDNFPLFDSVVTSQLCKEYYLSRSGEKTITPMYRYLLDSLDNTTANQSMADMICTKFYSNWKKVIDTLNIPYNALHNEVEHIQETNIDNRNYSYNEESENNGEVASKETVTRSTNNEDTVFGFNSVSPVGDSNSEENYTETSISNPQENTTKDSSVKNGSESTSDNKLRIYDRDGRSGSAPKLLNDEIIFRYKHIIFDIIYKDIDSMTTLKIYE